MTSAPSRSPAARWNSNVSNRSRLLADVAAQAAWRDECQVSDPVPGSERHQFGGVRADLLLGRGRQVRRLGKRLAHASYSAGRDGQRAVGEPLGPTASAN